MATISNWNPFGVALDITATAGTIQRISATQYTVDFTCSWETYYNGASTNYGMSVSVGGVFGTIKTISPYDGTKRSSGSITFTATFSISGTGSAKKDIAVTFKNFNTDQNKSANKSVNVTVTVPALPSWTISYNANGGSGAPSAQTKFKDIALTLSSTKPKRANYTFKGWATSASGAVAYASGASYTTNAAATLYAVWELTYVKPKIYNFSVSRCDSNGTANESGKCLRLKCEWETTNSNPSARVYIYKANGNYSYTVFPLTGKSGEINAVYDFVELVADVSYTVSLNINDSGGDYEISATLNGLAFPFDAVMTEEGVGASVGKPAEVAGLFDVAFKTKFTGGILSIVAEENNDLDNLKLCGFYVSVNKGAASYSHAPEGLSGTFTIEVLSAGAEGQLMQRITACNKEAPKIWVRHFFQNAWGEWQLIFSGDTGWLDLELQDGITVGTEAGYLKGRIKNGVLYIKGDVIGIAANWKYFAKLPSALISSALASSTRFGGVYNMSAFCGLNLTSGGQLYVSANSTGSWDNTKAVYIDVAICL